MPATERRTTRVVAFLAERFESYFIRKRYMVHELMRVLVCGDRDFSDTRGLIHGTPLWEETRRGAFHELDSRALLREARDIIAGLELDKTVFRSDHASNYLSLEGRFPADKAAMARTLDLAIEGKLPTRPEFFRGL